MYLYLNSLHIIEMKLKQNLNKTVLKLFCFSQNSRETFLAVLANHSRYSRSYYKE